MSNPASAILVVIVTIFRKRALSTLPIPSLTISHADSVPMPAVPPVGVFLIAGCGADLLINICLTVLG